MASINYQARKKSRELEIAKMVYPEIEKHIRSINQEQPDFLANSIWQTFTFGVEVTELYRNQSSARLKNIPGYVEDIVDRGTYRHKDDPAELKPDEIEFLNPDGTIKQRFKAVTQVVPTLRAYLSLLAETIAEKSIKLANYAAEASYHSLLIFDTEAYFGGVPLNDLYWSLFSPAIVEALDKTGFREVYLVGQMEHENRYIPLKAYRLYANLQQFESYFLPTCADGIAVQTYIETTIAVLARTGLGEGVVHRVDDLIAFNYGDLAMQIDLKDGKRNIFLPVQYMDYSGGIKAEEFAATVAVEPSVIVGFTNYRDTHSFHSNFAFPWSK